MLGDAEVLQRGVEGAAGSRSAISPADSRPTRFVAPELAGEGWNNLNGLLTDAEDDDSADGRLVERSTRRRARP